LSQGPLGRAGAGATDITAAARGGEAGLTQLLARYRLPAAPHAPVGNGGGTAMHASAYTAAAAAVGEFAAAAQLSVHSNAGMGQLIARRSVLQKHQYMQQAVARLH
jgi:hypothetical protein